MATKAQALAALKETIGRMSAKGYDFYFSQHPAKAESLRKNHARVMEDLNKIVANIELLPDNNVDIPDLSTLIAQVGVLENSAYAYFVATDMATVSEQDYSARNKKVRDDLRAAKALLETPVPQVRVTQPSTANLNVGPAPLPVSPASSSGTRSRGTSVSSDGGSSSGGRVSPASSRDATFVLDKRETEQKIATSNAIKVVMHLAEVIISQSGQEGILRVPGTKGTIDSHVANYQKNKSSLIRGDNQQKFEVMGDVKGENEAAGTIKALFRTGEDMEKNFGIGFKEDLNNVGYIAEVADKIVKIGTPEKIQQYLANNGQAHQNALRKIAATLPASHLMILKTMLGMMSNVAKMQASSNLDSNKKLNAVSIGTAAPGMLQSVAHVDVGTDPQSTLNFNVLSSLWIADEQNTSNILEQAINARHDAGDYSDNIYNSKEELKLSEPEKKSRLGTLGRAAGALFGGAKQEPTIGQPTPASGTVLPTNLVPIRPISPGKTATQPSGFFPSGGHGGAASRSRSPSLTATAASQALIDAVTDYLDASLSELENYKKYPDIFAGGVGVTVDNVPGHIDGLIAQIEKSKDEIANKKGISDDTQKLLTELTKINSSGDAFNNYIKLAEPSKRVAPKK